MSGARRRRSRRRSPLRGRGQHFLNPSTAADLVGRAGIRPGELVLEVGTGTGVLTAELAAAGARVVTFEIDPMLARRAARRLACHPNVRLVTGDFLSQPLPRRPFRVVANLPFAGSTAILRRLLDRRVPLTRADVVVAWGAALGWVASPPTKRDVRMWRRSFELHVTRRIPAAAFTPPPSTDAALLVVTRRGRRLSNSGEAVTGSR